MRLLRKKEIVLVLFPWQHEVVSLLVKKKGELLLCIRLVCVHVLRFWARAVVPLNADFHIAVPIV